MRPVRFLPALAMAAALCAPAVARIDLVTLPDRDAGQITIYQEEDLTLVRETRTLTLKKGLNRVQFNWSNTLMDPSSLHVRVMKDPAAFRLLDTSFPPNTQDTAIFTIEADRDEAVPVEIRAFASGFSWDAAYFASANPEETLLRVEPWFRLTNRSGADMEDVSARLVVGEVNLLEGIALLAQQFFGLGDRRERASGRGGAKDMELDDLIDGKNESGLRSRAKKSVARTQAEFIKKSVSEYQLYTIAGETTLKDQWAAGMPNPVIRDIPIEVAYELNPAKYGWQIVRLYRFINDSGHKLGAVPLPQGMWLVRGDDPRGGPRFIGATDHKYTPIGEDVELNLGSDGMLLFEEREMSRKRESFEFDRDGDIRGWDERRTVEIELRNAGAREVPVKLRMPTSGSGWRCPNDPCDWSIPESSDPFKKIDRGTVEWEVKVGALATKTIKFTFVTRQGSRAKAN